MGYTLQPIDPLSGRKLAPPTFRRSLFTAPATDAPPATDLVIDEDPYPEGGNIADVLAWVDDPTQADGVRSARAKAAVVAEHGRGKPRTTLLAELSERTG